MTDLQTPNDTVETRSLNLDPITGAPGSHPVGTGVGAAGGMSAGLAIGTAVGGPLGSAVGGLVGAVAGAIAGSSLGEVVNPTGESVDTVVIEPTATTVAGDEVIDPVKVIAGDSLQAIDPVAEDLYWQRAFITEPYYDENLSYDDYGPAYRTGIATRLAQQGRHEWDHVENELALLWPRRKGISRLDWEQAREPMRAAWSRVDHALTVEDPYFGTAE